MGEMGMKGGGDAWEWAGERGSRCWGWRWSQSLILGSGTRWALGPKMARVSVDQCPVCWIDSPVLFRLLIARF